MAFIPEDARWYLADVVLEHVVEGERRNLVWVNAHLIEAASPEEAYRKALKLGRTSQHRFMNTDRKRVRTVFRGLWELGVIHDELEDGAELSYTESVGVPESKLRRWATPKRKLSVFAPRRARLGIPNCMPLTIMRALEAKGFSRAEIHGRPERASRRLSSKARQRRASQPRTRRRGASSPRRMVR